jgi:hypothetical protein
MIIAAAENTKLHQKNHPISCREISFLTAPDLQFKLLRNMGGRSVQQFCQLLNDPTGESLHLYEFNLFHLHVFLTAISRKQTGMASFGIYIL